MAALQELVEVINSIPSPRQLLTQLPLLGALFSAGLVSEANAIANAQSGRYNHALQIQSPISLDDVQAQAQSCPPPSLSCPAQAFNVNANPIDECCLEATNSGHFLSTQFWDTNPSIGPEDSWTLHGLWPDRCAGGFEQYCDNTRTTSPRDLERILGLAGDVGSGDQNGTDGGRKGLLEFMRKYWLSMDHRDSNLWAHEWNKHGTCISTLKPECYDYGYDGTLKGEATAAAAAASANPTEMKNHEDILDYFVQATVLFAHLDTYAFLKNADILPTHDRTYTLSDIETAIQASFAQSISSATANTTDDQNKPVSIPPPQIGTTLRCNRNHELQEVWYHFLIRGPLRHPLANFTHPHDPAMNPIMKTFMPTQADGQISNCPKEGVKYVPKRGAGAPPSPPPPRPPYTSTHTSTSTRVSSTPEPTAPFTGRGYLKVRVLSTGISRAEEAEGQREEEVKEEEEEKFQGCLIRAGTWYVSGTCATYTARTDVVRSNLDTNKHKTKNNNNNKKYDEEEKETPHLFTLDSSYAPCAILVSGGTPRHRTGGVHGEEGQFLCARGLPVQTVFGSGPSADADGDGPDSVLSYNNRTTFYADRLPGRFEKVSVFADDGDGGRDVKLEIYWQGL